MNEKTDAGVGTATQAGTSTRTATATGTAEPPEDRIGKLHFVLQARLARGSMTVGQLLGMKPGSVIRSSGAPGDRVTLCAGRVVIGFAEPVVAEEKLALRVHSLEQTPLDAASPGAADEAASGKAVGPGTGDRTR